jgi:shikimate kinase
MIIGIAGPSCSGKTTLVKKLSSTLDAEVLHLDKYFIEEQARPIVNGYPSYEQPQQYDGMAMLDDLVEASEQAETVIAEGFLLFNYAGFTTLCDHMFYLDVPHEILKQRRLARMNDVSTSSQVEGGRIKEADEAWQAHGHIEWRRYGEMQANIPGMNILHAANKTTDELEEIILRKINFEIKDAA